MWLSELLKEINLQQQTTTILCDNQATITELNDTYKQFSERLRHLAVSFYHVKEQIKEKEISVKYVPSADNLADIFTKSLPIPAFTKLRDMVVHPC